MQRGEVPLFQVRAIVHLGHAQGDGTLQRGGGDAGAAVQDERCAHAGGDGFQAVEVEGALAFDQDVDVADADGQQIDAGLLHKRPGLLRVGHGRASLHMAGGAARQLPEFRFHGHAARMRIGHDFFHPLRIVRRRSLGVGRHDEIEAGVARAADPVIARAFVEDEAARHGRGRRGRLAQRGVHFQAFLKPAFRAAQEIAVEANDDGRAGGFCGVDHALQRIEAPAFEIAQGIFLRAGSLNQLGNGVKRHCDKILHKDGNY